MSWFSCLALSIALPCSSALYAADSASGKEESAIRASIAASYDKPKLKVETHPIVVSGDYALADWRQGEKGGRALLQKKAGKWSILACGGNGFLFPAHLASAGIPEPVAQDLTNRLKDAEKNLPSAVVAQFGQFDAAQTGHSSSGHHH